MADERLYREDEVQKIFEAASTEPDTRYQSASTRNALTLRELQDIGREVGIEPARIAQAALTLDSVPASGTRFGVPFTVRKTVPLPRIPTEAEWLMIVTDLRETFDAAGKLGTNIGIYEWRNGNLHAFIEPTIAGYRLRMGTRKDSVMLLGALGAMAFAWGTLTVIGLLIPGTIAESLLGPAIMVAVGAGGFGTALVRLRSWARTRAAQMEDIGRRVQALLSSRP